MPEKTTLKYWKIAFGLSLALNFLILGVVGSAVMNGSDARSSASGLRGDALFAMTAMLPRSERDAFREEMRKNKRSSVDKLRASHLDDLVVELRRPDFSQERFTAVLKRGRDARKEGTQRAEKALTERLATLSLEAREAYADRLMRATKHGPKPRK